ncbi:MAG: hypothetical protein ACK4Q5_02320 [Saprospiraceae bacterium]
MFERVLCVVFCVSCASFFGCGSADKPLDADTRQTIDSLVAVRTREVRTEMDTLCARNRVAELPRLVDSIKQVRKKEIEQALKTVPK